jgi:hypothetical protein
MTDARPIVIRPEEATPESGGWHPGNLVHREATTPDADREAFIVRVGDGPHVVNTHGPE